MGTMTGQNIVDRAWIKSHDSGGGGGVRWPSEEALMWVNDAQREIVNQLAKSNTKSAQPTMVAGARQSLSGLSITDGIEIIDVVCNVSGATRGKPVRKERRAVMDMRLGWLDESGIEVLHWVFDERDPQAFYVWPQVTNGKIEIVYSASPTDLADLTDTIDLPDIYANAIQWFVLFSFYSKDTKVTASMQRATTYYQLFQSSLGLRDRSVVGNATAGTEKTNTVSPAELP